MEGVFHLRLKKKKKDKNHKGRNEIAVLLFHLQEIPSMDKNRILFFFGLLNVPEATRCSLGHNNVDFQMGFWGVGTVEAQVHDKKGPDRTLTNG